MRGEPPPVSAAAATRGAKLVVLPENFAFMGPDSERGAHAEVLGDVDAPIQRALSSLARRHAIFLVGGGMPERSENAERPFNTAVVLDPTGKVVAIDAEQSLLVIRGSIPGPVRGFVLVMPAK